LQLLYKAIHLHEAILYFDDDHKCDDIKIAREVNRVPGTNWNSVELLFLLQHQQIVRSSRSL
jgi:hypothetical protein